MSLNNIKGFEPIEHQIYGGEVKTLPLYVDPEHGLTPDSAGLLEAATIISANLEVIEGGLTTLVDDVGKLVSEPGTKGVIIEDRDGAGSVSIDAHLMKVTTLYGAQWNVSTELLFDMLYVWLDYTTSPKVSEQKPQH